MCCFHGSACKTFLESFWVCQSPWELWIWRPFLTCFDLFGPVLIHFDPFWPVLTSRCKNQETDKNIFRLLYTVWHNLLSKNTTKKVNQWIIGVTSFITITLHCTQRWVVFLVYSNCLAFIYWAHLPQTLIFCLPQLFLVIYVWLYEKCNYPNFHYFIIQISQIESCAHCECLTCKMGLDNFTWIIYS